MKLDGVFLDLYGTLTTGDRQAVETTCAQIVRDTGLALSAEELSVIWGERFLQAIESCNGDGFLNLFDLEAQTLAATLAPFDVPVEPVIYATMLREYWRDPPLQSEVPRFLAEFPLPICIVSNADQDDAEQALARRGVQVADLITSEEVRSYKPDPRIFHAALERTGWRRDRVIHVGDSLHSDIGGALAAGIRNVWVNRSHRIHDIGIHRPDFEIEDLSTLADIVSR